MLLKSPINYGHLVLQLGTNEKLLLEGPVNLKICDIIVD